MAWPPPANASRSTAPPSSSPPTKASLKAWWKHFTFAQRIKKEAGQTYRSPAMPKNSTVFGIPLHESLKYANVHISTANANGELYVWGYIPVVVAKCGLYLKENGTEVEGTFRVSGSNKRMRDLQALFDTPPRYGKDLDWSKNTFTTHDVASVFRRYLTQMPEPVIPYSRYLEFREVLARDPPLREEAAIAAYKKLILSLPRPNQYLLLYVLDLLSVFARKSEINRMTAENLAVIFRPGILNHPSHEMVPTEHRLNQQVLEFLIAHQDWFMLDVPPPQRNDSILGPLTLPQPKRDIYAMPSQTVGEHGEWEGKNVANSIGRRRTTNDHRSVVDKRSEDDNGIEFSGRKQGAILEGGEDVILGTGDVSVKRSRTHPSKHSTSGRSVTRGTQDDTMASRKGSIRKPVPS